MSRKGDALPLHVPKALLDSTFQGTACRIGGKILTGEGWLRPSAISQPYRIRLTYKLGDTPEVFLIEPDPYALADAVKPGRRIPHVYGGNLLRLCLYLPGEEWGPTDPLATTILPWACEWLGFFEDWVFTDVWSGGGVHPEAKEIEPQTDQQPIPGAAPDHAAPADALSCT